MQLRSQLLPDSCQTLMLIWLSWIQIQLCHLLWLLSWQVTCASEPRVLTVQCMPSEATFWHSLWRLNETLYNTGLMQTLTSGESSIRVRFDTDFLLMGLRLICQGILLLPKDFSGSLPLSLVSTVIPRAQTHIVSFFLTFSLCPTDRTVWFLFWL